MPEIRFLRARPEAVLTYITIAAYPKPRALTAGNRKLGQTARALKLQEGDAPPVLYIPAPMSIWRA